MVNMRGKYDINREIQPLFQQRLNFKICKNITSVYSILKEFQEHWRLHSSDSCIVLENPWLQSQETNLFVDEQQVSRNV